MTKIKGERKKQKQVDENLEQAKASPIQLVEAEAAPEKPKVVTINIECVSIVLSERPKKCKNVLAIVAISNENEEIIYYKKIKRDKNILNKNKNTVKIVGFDGTKGELEGDDAEEEETVQSEVKNILNQHDIVVVCGGADLEMLNIKMDKVNFEKEDIQNHFWRIIPKYTNYGIEEEQHGHSLRSLVFHYSKRREDIQVGIHDAGIDAKYTMRLWKLWQKHKAKNRSCLIEGHEEIISIKDLVKQKIYIPPKC